MNNKSNKDWRDWFADLLGVRPDDRGELLELLGRLERTDNLLNAREFSMIRGVLRLTEWKIRDVMLLRSDVISMRITDDYQTAVKCVCKWQHSRYPVFDKNDETVVGILLAKDLLGFTDEPQKFVMSSVMRKPVFEPLTKSLDALLDDFRQQRSHMIIALDEHARMVGAVTIEDLLERIVGEIQDESDDEDDLPAEPMEGGKHRVRGTMSVEEFNDFFGSAFTAGTSVSIGGWLAAEAGQMPTTGENITRDGFVFTIEKADERRIYTVIVKPEK